MLLEDIRRSIGFTMRLLRRPKLWLTLAALYAVPILNIAALGYFARVAAEASQEPPPLRPLSRAFVLGLRVLTVMLAYGLLAIAVAALTLIVAFSNPVSVVSTYGPHGEASVALVAILFTVALLGMPVALAVAARRGVEAALNPMNSWRIIFNIGLGEYLAYLAAALSLRLLMLMLAAAIALPMLIWSEPTAWGTFEAPEATVRLAMLIPLILAEPPMEIFLWRWSGLIVEWGEGITEGS